MADVHTKEIRSYNMSRIKGRNTKPEMLVSGRHPKSAPRVTVNKHPDSYQKTQIFILGKRDEVLIFQKFLSNSENIAWFDYSDRSVKLFCYQLLESFSNVFPDREV